MYLNNCLFHIILYSTFFIILILDYWTSCKAKEKGIMTLAEILKMRTDTTGVYFEFIEFFISCVIGKNHFKSYRCDKLLSEFATVSDEAMAILIFENNIETWIHMVENNITKKSLVVKKYTNGGSSKGEVASSRRFHGWSSHGMNRFNELFDLVKADRTSEGAKSFEESFQEFCVNGGVTGKGKKIMQPLFEEVQIRHELWDEQDESHPYLHIMQDETVKSLKNSNEENGEDSEDEDPFGVNVEPYQV